MPTFAVACVHTVNMGAAIVEYLERIDETLEPFGGRFLVHGGTPELLEGSWPGALIIIEFPDRERARGWYVVAGLPVDSSAAHAEFRGGRCIDRQRP